jgi:hypothetical protein
LKEQLLKLIEILRRLPSEEWWTILHQFMSGSTQDEIVTSCRVSRRRVDRVILQARVGFLLLTASLLFTAAYTIGRLITAMSY